MSTAERVRERVAVPRPGRRPRPVLQLHRISKTYGVGETTVHALAQVSLRVAVGDYVAVMGASGSGKSTLMNIIGCLDVPTSGRYLLDGLSVDEMDESQLAYVRNRKIGFIFQSFNLIPRVSALANVELPLAYAGVPGKERRRRALAALDAVDLSARAGHRPNELSGGQQQRVAVARAIASDPVLLLADEPTGALDSRSTESMLRLFDDLNADGRTVVLITHENDVAAHAKRLLVMRDGHLVEDTRAAPVTGRPPLWSPAPTAEMSPAPHPDGE